jgi:hypothetical protein
VLRTVTPAAAPSTGAALSTAAPVRAAYASCTTAASPRRHSGANFVVVGVGQRHRSRLYDCTGGCSCDCATTSYVWTGSHRPVVVKRRQHPHQPQRRGPRRLRHPGGRCRQRRPHATDRTGGRRWHKRPRCLSCLSCRRRGGRPGEGIATSRGSDLPEGRISGASGRRHFYEMPTIG